jgi:hypothetical protein
MLGVSHANVLVERPAVPPPAPYLYLGIVKREQEGNTGQVSFSRKAGKEKEPHASPHLTITLNINQDKEPPESRTLARHLTQIQQNFLIPPSPATLPNITTHRVHSHVHNWRVKFDSPFFTLQIV